MNNALNFIEEASLLARSLGSLVLALPEETEGITAQNGFDTKEILGQNMFMFDYEESNEIILESETSDHYTEEGSVLNDNITNKPEIISLTGYIGELTTRISGGLRGDEVNRLRQYANRLTVLGKYAPQLTVTALENLNRAEKIYRDAQYMTELATEKWVSVNSASNNGIMVITGSETEEELSRKLSKVRNQSNQQKAAQTWYSFWKKRTLFTVKTPFAVFKNCAIISISMKQDDSKNVSTFSVKMKAMRLAKTREIDGGSRFEIDFNDTSPIMKNQITPYTDNGTSTVGQFVGMA